MSGTRIPLIDSCTHPTLNGRWLRPDQAGYTVDGLLADMDATGVIAAVCVGMKGVGDYDPQAYAEALAPHRARLLPVAFFDFDRVRSAADVEPYLRALEAAGYRAVKIHPRASHITLAHPLLPTVLSCADALGLPPMLCTYFHDAWPGSHGNNPIELRRLLEVIAGTRLMLVHGGTVNVLETMEIVRPHPRLLLDLSLTLCKYAGSSVDLDLAYLFEHFDRRICVGSDYPEYPLATFRARFERFAHGLALDKRERIAHRNVAAFFGMSVDAAV